MGYFLIKVRDFIFGWFILITILVMIWNWTTAKIAEWWNQNETVQSVSQQIDDVKEWWYEDFDEPVVLVAQDVVQNVSGDVADTVVQKVVDVKESATQDVEQLMQDIIENPDDVVTVKNAKRTYDANGDEINLTNKTGSDEIVFKHAMTKYVKQADGSYKIIKL